MFVVQKVFCLTFFCIWRYWFPSVFVDKPFPCSCQVTCIKFVNQQKYLKRVQLEIYRYIYFGMHLQKSIERVSRLTFKHSRSRFFPLNLVVYILKNQMLLLLKYKLIHTKILKSLTFKIKRTEFKIISMWREGFFFFLIGWT